MNKSEFEQFIKLRKKYINLFAKTFFNESTLWDIEFIYKFLLPLYVNYRKSPSGFMWSDAFEDVRKTLNVDLNDEKGIHRLKTIVNRRMTKFETKGLIKKIEDQNDKRKKKYIFTAKAKKFFDEIDKKLS